MKNLLCSLFLIGSLAGCASKQPLSTTDLGDLRGLGSSNLSETDAVSGIRYTALRDSALSLGARAGLAGRGDELNMMLKSHDRSLSRAFNFQPLLLEDNVLPPVLVEGRNTLDLASLDTIRIAARSYTIYSQARFITAAPTWRDYLFSNFSSPERPDRTLLPRNKAERVIWDRFIQQGWLAGIEQADNIFSESIGRLKRDFMGMIRYRTLLDQNMVSPPFVAKIDLGVTGGGDSIAVDDRVLRITELPTLSSDSREWKTDITGATPKHDNHMRY